MKIGFTGTQDASAISSMAEDSLRDVMTKLADQFEDAMDRHGVDDETQLLQFHHGDCIGADAMAHKIAVGLGIRVIIHPPLKNDKRAFCHKESIISNLGEAIYVSVVPPKPYLDRNQDIVDSVDVLIGMPKDIQEEEVRSGTWSTIRRARKKRIPIYFVDASTGEVQEEIDFADRGTLLFP